MCSLYIYTSQYVKGNFTVYKVYNIFFEDRHRKANVNLYAILLTVIHQLTTLH